ncbi:MAG: rane protein [Jatrophihabitantaceae bacterium]|nr:rane protein [Jatrophihabitantaceae bacterium]
MIASGGISTVAGASFLALASMDDPRLSSLAGYAVLGGVFSLISALRLKPAADAPIGS